jgi:hypothetical protein
LTTLILPVTATDLMLALRGYMRPFGIQLATALLRLIYRDCKKARVPPWLVLDLPMG